MGNPAQNYANFTLQEFPVFPIKKDTFVADLEQIRVVQRNPIIVYGDVFEIITSLPKS